MRIALFTAAAVFALATAAYADDDKPSPNTNDTPGDMQQPIDQGQVPPMGNDDMAGQNPSGADAAGSQAMTPDFTLERLHAINLSEIKAGKLAKTNGSPTIQSYAARLIKDHEQADKEVKATAKTMHYTVLGPTKFAWPAGVEEKMKSETAMMGDLKTLKGKAFDQKFLPMMSSGHEQALDFLAQAKENIQAAPIQSLITKLQPTLEKHKQTADDLLNQENMKVQGRR